MFDPLCLFCMCGFAATREFVAISMQYRRTSKLSKEIRALGVSKHHLSRLRLAAVLQPNSLLMTSAWLCILRPVNEEQVVQCLSLKIRGSDQPRIPFAPDVGFPSRDMRRHVCLHK